MSIDNIKNFINHISSDVTSKYQQFMADPNSSYYIIGALIVIVCGILIWRNSN